MKDKILSFAIAAYFLAGIVSFGHYVSRSGDCGADDKHCHGYRIMNGVFFVGPAWPLYVSVKAWEN